MLKKLKESNGQSFAEYGLIAGLVILIVIVGLTAMKDQVFSVFSSVQNSFTKVKVD